MSVDTNKTDKAIWPWRPISELPERLDGVTDILVVIDSGNGECFVAQEQLGSNGWTGQVSSYATHWMPMPSPPGNQNVSGIPHNALCFFQDGDKWCCVFGDFKNLQESPAGFGESFDEALDDLEQLRSWRQIDHGTY